MDAREIKDLLRFVKNAGFHEVELELEGFRLRVVKDRPVNGAPEGAVAVPLPAAVPAAPAAATPPAPETASAGAAVEKAPAAAEAEI
ncbi:MAG: acetyl-CoA carboxylase, biotin carboxyl carrier protein, partial [Acidobacteria bacterium]